MTPDRHVSFLIDADCDDFGSDIVSDSCDFMPQPVPSLHHAVSYSPESTQYPFLLPHPSMNPTVANLFTLQTKIFAELLEETSPDKNLQHWLEKAQKKASKGKPKGFPAKARCAYNFFFKSERAKLLEESPKETKKAFFTGLTKIIGAKWKSLTPKGRQPYEREAEKDKERFVREVASFNKDQQVQV